MEFFRPEGSLVSPEMERALARWRRIFYGKSLGPGEHPTLLAAAITAYLAELTTGEIHVSLGDGQRAAYLAEQLKPALAELPKTVQLAAVEGLCVLRPRVEDSGLRVDVIGLDRFYPTRCAPDGQFTAGVFVDERQVGRQTLTRLEGFDLKNGVLRLTNHVFCGGREVPLDSLEEWKDLEQETVVEQAKSAPFGVLKMPFLGTVEPGNALPVSLFSGAEASLREFDRVYGELLYEVHSGKRKRIIERQALPALSAKKTPNTLGFQDFSTDTYLVLDPMEQQKPFDDYSPEIRADAYLASLRALLRLIENQCHLSPGSLPLEAISGAPATATEVISRDKTTYNTCRTVQESGLRPALTGLISAADQLCDLYDLCPPEPLDVKITFGDSVFEDTDTELARRLKLLGAGAISAGELRDWYFT